MNAVVRTSVVLAAIVSVVIALIAVTGMHNPLLAIVVFTAINIAVVFWGLSKTATNPYLKQLGNAALIGLLGGVLIALASWVLMRFVFPNYLEEAGQAALDFMESVGAPEAQIEEQAAKMGQMTASSQAFQGALGTFVTSLVSGAIIAIFKRRK